MLKFKNAFTRSKSSTREAHQPDQSAADKFHQNVQRKQSSDNNDRHQQQQQQQQQQQVHVEPQQQQQQQRPRRTLAERASFASLRERRAAKQSRKRAPSKPRRSASFEGDRRSPAVPASITSSTTSSSTSSFTPPPSPHQGSDQTAPTVKRNPHHHQARVSKRTLTVGPYRLSKTLGQGSMGKVKLATHAITGEKVCYREIS
ncbi:hypothetical protein DFJ77DRAFT_66231 [Powellomyces hirtus]|nr:hypothetical protein DFJ77DRAFT_66231 [Powellomyces hirtus]